MLPRLAIDLDAHDNPYVRQATEDDYAVKPKPSRWQAWQPLEPTAMEKTLKKELKRDPPARYTLDIQKITPPDLLAYALGGDPNASPTAQNLALRKQFRRQKVHPLDNADTKTKRLTYDFTTDASKALEDAGFTSELGEMVAQEIQNSTSFSSFKRMITMLSSTTNGCKYLAGNGGVVMEAIRRHRKHQGSKLGKSNYETVTSEQVLRVLNNLFLNLRLKGVDSGAELWSGGLYYASKSSNLPSVRRYLQLSQDKPYSPQLRELSAITEIAISHNRRSAFRPFGKHHMDKEEQRQEVLRILTGWSSKGSPSQGEERQLCFASHVVARRSSNRTPLEGAPLTSVGFARVDNSSRRIAYILALGYIGANNALWYEWSNDSAHAVTEQNSRRECTSSASQHLGLHGEVLEAFALAFLIAGDQQHALDVIRTFVRPESVDKDESLVQSFPARRFLNLEVAHDVLSRPSKTSQQLIQLSYRTRLKILRYYMSHNVTPGQRLKERLESITFTGNPETILRAIGDVLVPEWMQSLLSRNALCKTHSARDAVDWVEQDGVEGVAIIRGNEIVYFKPSSQRASTQDIE